MLECISVTCSQGGRQLFQNLSFTAKMGSITLISGRNGSGKTTLLRVIVGLQPPLSGSIKFQGEAINLFSNCLSHLTYVGHKNACNENMTVWDTLMFWARCKSTEPLVLAALCFFGLQPILELRFKELSAGWKRRVALSRLLISNTKIWIIDEPFANLDSESMNLVQGLILTRAEQGGIIVLADHIGHTKFTDAQTINLETHNTDKSST